MRLPAFFRQISPVGETLTAIEGVEAVLEAETARRNDQLSVSTAGADGLALWERDYALQDGTAVSDAVRRVRIRAAMLGGQTLSRETLKAMAKTLGEADGAAVEEEFPDYTVTLTVLYDGRQPPDLLPLQQAVERLKPAHLKVEVVPMLALRGTLRRYHALAGKVFLTLTDRNEN